MTAHQAVHRVTTMCRILGVSPSGYYAWRKRPMAARTRADVELTAYIDEIHRTSRGTYGAPRVHAELAALGIHVGCKRVARLMRALGVHGVSRRKRPLRIRPMPARQCSVGPIVWAATNGTAMAAAATAAMRCRCARPN